MCSGAEYLLRIVREAIPGSIFEFDSSFSAADVATYILNKLYRNLSEICLLQGGEVVNPCRQTNRFLLSTCSSLQ